MSNFDIRINIRNLTNYTLKSGISTNKKTILLMIEDFSYYIRNLYLLSLEESINSKRYKGKWEPIEEKGYIEYLGVTPKVPIMSLIEDSMEVKKVGYNFIVEINPKYKYPGSKLPLVKVLRAIDRGTSDFNSRPIFNKIISEMRRRVMDLWRGYLLKKGVI